MLITNKVKIGCEIYDIIDDAEMYGTELGSMESSLLLIRMRTKSQNNRNIPIISYFKTLVHEIVHGFDNNIFFIGVDKVKEYDEFENCIELVSNYIIRNLDDIIKFKEDQFDHFSMYIDACETSILRRSLLFSAILDFIEDNKDLVEEIGDVFK